MSVAAICRNMLENLLKVPSNSEKAGALSTVQYGRN